MARHPAPPRLPGRAARLLAALACLPPVPAAAQSAPPAAEESAPREEAWFTGPMLANSAGTLPKGHFLVEPYLYDVEAAGARRFGSLTYILYGLSDAVTIGVKPAFMLIEGGPRGTRVGAGDLTLQAQVRLRTARGRDWSPAFALSLQQSLPTGRYDRLEDDPQAGLGSGAYATTFALYAQASGKIAGGRTLRARINLALTVPGAARVEGVSVYGSGKGFAGTARGGESAHIGLAAEYSLTRRWALALDLFADRRATTIVAGKVLDDAGRGVDEVHRLPSGWSVGAAPGLEYSWSPNFGVLLAARYIAAGPTGGASITPAVAVNMVF